MWSLGQPHAAYCFSLGSAPQDFGVDRGRFIKISQRHKVIQYEETLYKFSLYSFDSGKLMDGLSLAFKINKGEDGYNVEASRANVYNLKIRANKEMLSTNQCRNLQTRFQKIDS